jgi:hypothetical protein
MGRLSRDGEQHAVWAAARSTHLGEGADRLRVLVDQLDLEHCPVLGVGAATRERLDAELGEEHGVAEHVDDLGHHRILTSVADVRGAPSTGPRPEPWAGRRSERDGSPRTKSSKSSRRGVGSGALGALTSD